MVTDLCTCLGVGILCNGKVEVRNASCSNLVMKLHNSGSAWTILSRSFAEYSILGWENLPRTLLLYYTNFVSSPEGYFQTLICNSDDYRNTTANHDLHYITWDVPPKQHPRSLGLRDYHKMVLSSRPFARKFKKNDAVLDKIDRDLLKRRRGEFSYGGWCSNGTNNRGCSDFRSEGFGVLNPGPGSRRLKNLLTKLLSDRFFRRQQCRWGLLFVEFVIFWGFSFFMVKGDWDSWCLKGKIGNKVVKLSCKAK